MKDGRRAAARGGLNAGRASARSAGGAQAPDGDGRARLPSISALLAAAAGDPALRASPRGALTSALREAVDTARHALAACADGVSPPALRIEDLLERAACILMARRAGRIRRVINATGIILHTGLGRSVLPSAALRRIAETAAGYCSLEIDLATGERGRRGDYAEDLLRGLTGAEAALVVNNNAAATMLALRGLAAGREVIVSRGQLIEIGGSFRLPEVMAAGGATLREVGTTNKTRLADYEAAIGERTGLILHVHTSNYRVVGFAESPGAAELAELAHRRKLPMMDDLGSGALQDHPIWAAAGEPTAQASLCAGADVVCFSGDKLLGGPQAGILLGKTEIIDRLRKDPMARALRVDKLTLAALEATLELYQSPEPDPATGQAGVRTTVPTLRMLTEDEATLTARAEELRARLAAALPGERFEVREDESYAGGGSLPARPLLTRVVAWHVGPGDRANRLAHALRTGEPAVLARVREDSVVFDVRTMSLEEDEPVAEAARISAGIHHSRAMRRDDGIGMK